jgi:hypothetical protein
MKEGCLMHEMEKNRSRINDGLVELDALLFVLLRRSSQVLTDAAKHAEVRQHVKALVGYLEVAQKCITEARKRVVNDGTGNGNGGGQ